jgi:hypothetical protein
MRIKLVMFFALLLGLPALVGVAAENDAVANDSPSNNDAALAIPWFTIDGGGTVGGGGCTLNGGFWAGGGFGLFPSEQRVYLPLVVR